MDYEAYLDLMGTDTVGRFDVTLLFSDPKTFETLRSDLLASAAEPTAVVGIDALGFVLGGALATDLGVGFVPVRKESFRTPKRNCSAGRCPTTPVRRRRWNCTPMHSTRVTARCSSTTGWRRSTDASDRRTRRGSGRIGR